MILALLFLLPALSLSASYLYVGSFTGTTVSTFEIQSNGNLAWKGQTQVGAGPTWFSVRNNILFTTNEVDGAVASFKINPNDGSLTFISRRLSLGGSPTYLTLDKSGKYLLVANYNSGSVVTFTVGSDGTIGQNTSFSQHTGKGKDPNRQSGPHAHQIIFDNSNSFAFSCDLGVDKIYQYKFDQSKGSLTPNEVPFVSTNSGDGPRHLVFHPTFKFAYVACELSSTLIAYSYNAQTGRLTQIQRLPLPGLAASNKNNFPAEILVDAAGSHVYVSNRGNDSVSVFTVNTKYGYLNQVQLKDTKGKTPRGLMIDEELKVIYSGNMDSGSVTVLPIATGGLSTASVAATGLYQPVAFIKYPVVSRR